MVQESKWFDTSYLRTGNSKQQFCYRILSEINILTILEQFQPVVIGTIPIGIDIAGSDLDIACFASEIDIIENVVRENFRAYPGFTDRKSNINYVAGFYCEGIELEIYAEPIPVYLQNGFRHMVIEDRILHLAGECFRNDVIRLKNNGYKTEPAFGQLLKMNNPYMELFDLENLPDNGLKAFINDKYMI